MEGSAANMDDRMKKLEEDVERINAEIARLAGPHIQVVAGSVGPEGQIVEGPHAEVVAAEGPPPGMSVAEWISAIRGSPGIIVDPGVARSTPCLELELGDDHKPLVYSRGIIGPLDEDQQALYCQEGLEKRPISEHQRARLTTLRDAAHLCSSEAKDAPLEDHLDAYYGCMGRELKRRGEEA